MTGQCAALVLSDPGPFSGLRRHGVVFFVRVDMALHLANSPIATSNGRAPWTLQAG